MSKHGNRSAPAAGLVRVVGLAAAASAIGTPWLAARADDDDPKLLNRQPAIKAPVWRTPDAWKLQGLEPPAMGGPDATFESRNVQLLAWIPTNNFPGYSGAFNNTNGADCWGYTSPSGREYVLMGLGWGIGVVEVTDPSQPSLITTIPGSDSLWHDVTVIGQYAYAVSDQTGPGIQVIDLHNIDAGQVTLVRNFSQGGHTTTHTIVSNPDSGHLYLCGGNAAAGGMIAATTLNDPTFPTFVGTGWRNQYVHEAQIVTYTSGPYEGREIAFLFAAGPYYGASYTTALAIADVTDKANIVTLSQIPYPGMRFCHQGWITDDRKYLYINDELDSTGSGSGSVPRFLARVFDISDLANPRLVSTFNNGLPSVDHNEYVVGRYLYQSNYTTGLRVWDISDPLRPTEVGWIDTRPEDDGTGYNGAWGNYPYFASGTIAISDIQRGLFLVRLSILELTPTDPMPTLLAADQPTPVLVDVAERNAQVAGVSLMVSVDGGSYTAYPMTAQNGHYAGSIPAARCGQAVSYYIKAMTADDAREFTWPPAGQAEPIRAFSQGPSPSVLFSDDFQANLGWTVSNTSVAAGAWVRATPLYNGGPGAVIGDADGSGMCYVTGNTLNQNVSGGPTRLISPILNLAAAPEARISVARWLLSIQGTTDSLVTEVSADGGTSWVQVDSINPVSGGWNTLEFRVADFITPTATVRVRFSVADSPNNSVTEAGIDAFKVTNPCGSAPAPCYANCDGSTAAPILNVLDFSCFLNRFAAGDSFANCDGSTAAPVLNVLDFSCFLNKFAAGCP
jgi:choice-of-anchor B domain-containing protein